MAKAVTARGEQVGFFNLVLYYLLEVLAAYHIMAIMVALVAAILFMAAPTEAAAEVQVLLAVLVATVQYVSYGVQAGHFRQQIQEICKHDQ
jgi:hypothetical protein